MATTVAVVPPPRQAAVVSGPPGSTFVAAPQNAPTPLGPPPGGSVLPPGSTQYSTMIPAVGAGQVFGYPPRPVAGTQLYVSSSLPPLVYRGETNAGDMRYQTYLADQSGGWINLDGAHPSENRVKPTAIIERPPQMPFFPGTYSYSSSSYGNDELGAIAQFVSRLKPKPIDPGQLRYALGWTRMPHPAPVYVAIPGFGVGVALYWTQSLLPVSANLPPVTMYAVLRLTPFPVSAVDGQYVGTFYKVFATWCVPMKIAISQFPTQASADPYNCVFVVDSGEEWRIPLDVVRTIYRGDVRFRVAVNAICRDYPWIENLFSFVPSLPPPDVTFQIVQYAQQVQQYQNALAGQGANFVQAIPGAPANYPGAIVRAPGRPAASSSANKDGDDDEEEDDDKTPATKPSKSTIDLSGHNVIRLTPWN